MVFWNASQFKELVTQSRLGGYTDCRNPDETLQLELDGRLVLASDNPVTCLVLWQQEIYCIVVSPSDLASHEGGEDRRGQS